MVAVIDTEKDTLTKALSEQYAQNVVSIEEYERILEYINKVETLKEIHTIEKIIQENRSSSEARFLENKGGQRHLSLFSWRNSNIKAVNGSAGSYFSVFGANRIVIRAHDLPEGKTLLNVNSIFGLTEIYVSRNVKIINKTVPVLAGIFAPDDVGSGEETSILYLTGKAVFGNITIRRTE
jgi:hypothetical protein